MLGRHVCRVGPSSPFGDLPTVWGRFVGVAPVLGFGAARMLSAEVSGIQQSRLTPRIVDTAKVLATIYLCLSVAEVIALLLAGMNLRFGKAITRCSWCNTSTEPESPSERAGSSDVSQWPERGSVPLGDVDCSDDKETGRIRRKDGHQV